MFQVLLFTKSFHVFDARSFALALAKHLRAAVLCTISKHFDIAFCFFFSFHVIPVFLLPKRETWSSKTKLKLIHNTLKSKKCSQRYFCAQVSTINALGWWRRKGNSESNHYHINMHTHISPACCVIQQCKKWMKRVLREI